MWYGPEPDVASSAGAGSGRKEIKQREERKKMQQRDLEVAVRNGNGV